MSEYIIEWSGIGARIVELIGSVHPCLIVKRLREERRREEIVRCRDCMRFPMCDLNPLGGDVNPNGYCAWGERRNDEG